MTLEAVAPFDLLFDGVDAFVWAETVDGEVFREAPGRRTSRILVDGRAYFLKVHVGHSLAERAKEWAALRRAPAGARQEVRALRVLERVGVRVPRVAAWGERGRTSFLVTEDVGTQETVGTLLERGGADAVTGAERVALIDAVADTVGRMHRAGVNHRDCYLVHLPLFALEGDATEIGLLDLHRAQVRAEVPLRWRAKDLGGLCFSAEGARLTPADVARFRDGYERASGHADAGRLWRRVDARVARLERERARRGERFGR